MQRSEAFLAVLASPSGLLEKNFAHGQRARRTRSKPDFDPSIPRSRDQPRARRGRAVEPAGVEADACQGHEAIGDPAS